MRHSLTVSQICQLLYFSGLAGFFPMHPMCIVQAKRNRKEQRLKEIELDKKRLETEEENARQNETAV